MQKLVLGVLAVCVLVLGGTVGPAGAARGGAQVKADNFSFTKQRVTIRKGQKVTWVNIEGAHTVTFRTINYDKSISGSQKVSKRFRKPGIYRYYCIPHESQGMKGVVRVRR